MVSLHHFGIRPQLRRTYWDAVDHVSARQASAQDFAFQSPPFPSLSKALGRFELAAFSLPRGLPCDAPKCAPVALFRDPVGQIFQSRT